MPQQQPQRRFIQIEGFTDLIHQVALVGKMHPIGIVNKTDEGGRPGRHLGGIIELEPLAFVQGRLGTGQGLLHHTDRGSQYASADYQDILKEHAMVCSMSGKGNCYDNAVMESFFGRLKSEWVNHHRYRNRSEAIHSLFYYIEIFYNRKRSHSYIDYATPKEYESFPLAA